MTTRLVLPLLLLIAAPAAAQAPLSSSSVRRVSTAQVALRTSRRVVVAAPMRSSATLRPSQPVSARPVSVRARIAQPAVVATPTQPTARGTFRCEITENGAPALGSYLLRGAGIKSEGECGRTTSVPAGVYTLEVRLGSRNEVKSSTLRIEPNQSAVHQARFDTSILEIRARSADDEPPVGVVVRQAGRIVARAGSDVPMHLPPGTYEVEVRVQAGYRHATGTRNYTVTLTAGQRRAITARF